MSAAGRPAPPDPLTSAAGGLARQLLRVRPPLARALALAWLTGIFFSSEVHGRPGVGTPLASFVFNLGHAVLYGGLACWTFLGLPDPVRRAFAPRTALSVVVATGLCGLLDELHQRLVPGRDFSLCDVVTDLVGAAGALWILASMVNGRGRDLWPRLALAMLAAGAAAAAATFLPLLRPTWGWL